MPPAISSLGEARAAISTLRAKAAAHKVTISEPPEEPLRESCCERGCERCVFTVYYEAVDAWQREIEAQLR